MAKILIAHDDAPLRDMLGAAFARNGHEVSFAKNAKEAARQLREAVFDLMLLSFILPDKNAHQLLSQLKLENALVPPFMILSAKVSHEVVRDCLDAGAKDIILKPFNLPVLVERAERLIGRDRKLFVHGRCSGPFSIVSAAMGGTECQQKPPAQGFPSGRPQSPARYPSRGLS